MKESPGEGVPTHTDPESCAAVREALTVVRLAAADGLTRAAEGVALGRLHLDDVGAEIAEHHRAERARHHLGEVHDAHPVQRPRGHGRLTRSAPAATGPAARPAAAADPGRLSGPGPSLPESC